MHEYGIVRELLGQVEQQVRAHAGKRAVRVVLAVDGGHVEESFLRDAFDTFKVTTLAHGAELVVTQAPVELWCPGCGETATAGVGETACPLCGAPGIRLAPADEICLESIEIEV